MIGRSGILALLLATAAGMAMAEPVEVRFAPPEAMAEVPVMWEAMPIDIPEATEELPIVGSGNPVTGPWMVALEPGTWQVNGWTDAAFLTGQFTVTKDSATFDVALQEPLPPPPYRCTEGKSCTYQDPATGLSFSIPVGWATNQPTKADLPDGAKADQVTVVFFEDVKAEGGEAWFLNPTEWSDAFGACREIALGRLCSFSATPASEAAFAIIEPSLKLAEPDAPAMQ